MVCKLSGVVRRPTMHQYTSFVFFAPTYFICFFALLHLVCFAKMRNDGLQIDKCCATPCYAWVRAWCACVCVCVCVWCVCVCVCACARVECACQRVCTHAFCGVCTHRVRATEHSFPTERKGKIQHTAQHTAQITQHTSITRLLGARSHLSDVNVLLPSNARARAHTHTPHTREKQARTQHWGQQPGEKTAYLHAGIALPPVSCGHRK